MISVQEVCEDGQYNHRQTERAGKENDKHDDCHCCYFHYMQLS